MGASDPYGRAGFLRSRTRGAAGFSREQAIARGEGAVRALHEDYRRNKLRADIDKLSAAVAADSSEAVLTHARQIKGLAATFGYDLADQISASLCRYVMAGAPGDRRRRTVLQAHLEALRCVAMQDVLGRGDKQQQALAAALAQLAGAEQSS